MAFASFLNPIVEPLFKIGPLWAILIISLVLSIIITLIYKYTTDQKQMKELKDYLKQSQEEMKKVKDDPKKVLEIQKKAMEKNFEYMKHTLMPMIITMIPVLIIFGWMAANFAYNPIKPDMEFTTTALFKTGTIGQITIIGKDLEVIGNATQDIINSKAQWTLKGKEGEYILQCEYKNKSYFKEMVITNGHDYKPIMQKIENSDITIITVDNEPIKPLNLFGWKIGWLGTYIIFSLIFSLLTRKVFNVY
jgi:uncharacterized membrane protein (DUF106 family)